MKNKLVKEETKKTKENGKAITFDNEELVSTPSPTEFYSLSAGAHTTFFRGGKEGGGVILKTFFRYLSFQR